MINYISNIIENIKEKPEYVRKRYAWALTLIFTLIIGAVWVTGLGDKFKADADLFKSFYAQQSVTDSAELLEESADDIQDILNGEDEDSTDEDLFDSSDLEDTSEEEARLPDSEEEEDSDDEVIEEDESEFEDIENFDDYTDEELQEYLQEKKDEFYEELEEEEED